jgi:hypothetical protein
MFEVMKKRIIAFDFDGVLADKPFFVPKNLIELLFKGHCKKELKFRYPKRRFNQLVRKLSHLYFLRPAIKSNIEFLKKLARTNNYEIYLVSGRYHFLINESRLWLKKNGLSQIFKKVIINTGDAQPHLFKQRTLQKIKAQVYVDDDPLISDYLQEKTKLKIYCYSSQQADCQKATWIKQLEDMKI